MLQVTKRYKTVNKRQIRTKTKILHEVYFLGKGGKPPKCGKFKVPKTLKKYQHVENGTKYYSTIDKSLNFESKIILAFGALYLKGTKCN